MGEGRVPALGLAELGRGGFFETRSDLGACAIKGADAAQELFRHASVDLIGPAGKLDPGDDHAEGTIDRGGLQ
jgi:hypothetical protein